MPSKFKESLVKELKRLSMKNDDDDFVEGDDVSAEWKKRAVSSYANNYKPLAAGIRTNLWADGFRQREERKKGGFKHFKLEWMAPTARRNDSPQNARASPDREGEAEPLFLLPTKLEKKRLQLQRIYEKKARKKSKIGPEGEDEFGSPAKPKTSGQGKLGLSEYEKNRLNNMQSHIVLPTFSSCATTTRSIGSSSRRSGSTRRSKSGFPKQPVIDKKQQQHQEKLIPSPVKQQQPQKLNSPTKQQHNSPFKQQYAKPASPTKQQHPKNANPSPTKQQHPKQVNPSPTKKPKNPPKQQQSHINDPQQIKKPKKA